jgi:hypothetical protein
MRAIVFLLSCILVALAIGPVINGFQINELRDRMTALEARMTAPGTTDIPRKDQSRMEVTP